MADLIQELKRRNVFRTAIAYLAVSWFVVEVATTILPLYPEAPTWLARSIVTILFIGFIPTLILSWAYEFTAKGLRREKQADTQSPSRPGINRIVDFVTGGAVVAAIALFLWSPQSSNRAPSVAVLPLANMSANAENEYFADGLTETLIHMLAQNKAIKVTSRTSVFAFKGKDIDVREVGEILGVAHVLEGSVQRSGDQLRITMQLIDTQDGTHIWSKNYDRSANDIFNIQDQIASVVSNALTTSLLARSDVTPGVGTVNLSAYDLFLHAVTRRVPATTDALAAAEGLLKEALVIDPEFLNAKTELGLVYYHQWRFGFRPWEDAYPEILSLTEQVLVGNEFDSRALALQLMTQAEIALIDGNFDVVSEIVDEMNTLVERSPNDIDARVFLARSLKYVGDPERVIEQLEAAAKIDPLRADIYWMMSEPQIGMEDMQGAEASLRRSLELNPNNVNAYLRLSDLQRRSGNIVGYFDNLIKARRLDPSDDELVTGVVSMLYLLQLMDEGDAYLQHIPEISLDDADVKTSLLLRAAALDDHELVIERARVLIREYSGGNALPGWVLGVKTILRSGISLGRGDESLAYVQEYASDLTGQVSEEVEFHVRISQRFALAELAQLLPSEDIRKLVEEIDEFYRATGSAPSDNAQYYADRLVALGEIEAAIEIYLADIFTLPPTMRPAIEWRLASPFYAELMADERMQTALQRSIEEVAEIREQAREYFATLDY